MTISELCTNCSRRASRYLVSVIRKYSLPIITRQVYSSPGVSPILSPPGSGPCLGWREGPTAPYSWISYEEVYKRAVQFGAGLCAIGLAPGQESMLGIYSQNNVEVRTLWVWLAPCA